MKPVELILERAEGVRRVGSGWMVSCPLPGHGRGFGDRNPSISVTEGDDSRALVNCQAGYETEDIVAEWGLTMADLFEGWNGHGGGESYTSRQTASTDQPVTRENYAADRPAIQSKNPKAFDKLLRSISPPVLPVQADPRKPLVFF